MGLNVTGMPSLYWFYGDFVFRHPFFAVCHIGSGSNGDAMFYRVEVDNIFELGLKGHTPLFEESYISLAIVLEFMLKIENVSFRYFFIVPLVEFIFAHCGHTVRVVVRFIRHVPNIVLILLGVEEMGVKAFL